MSSEVRFRAGQGFPTTCWSRVVAGPAADTAARRQAFETLAHRYWMPIVAFIRARWAKTDDDARDAAQEFMAWMLESEFLTRADPARGRFRGFLKTTLGNFLNDLERKKRRVKRGGMHRHETSTELPDPAGRTPDMLLDDLWRRQLLADATDGLESELRERGKGVTFDVFRDYFLGDRDLDYATVAERHGLSTTDVSNALTYAKKRFRAHLRTVVVETVHDDDDLRAELAWLFEATTA